MKLVEVCMKEPAKVTYGDPPKLDDIFDHPARFRYSNWWMNADGSIQMVGSQAYVPVKDIDEQGNFEYMGNQCSIVGEIDESRFRQGDRFVEITS